MPDVFTPEHRSRIMAAVRSKGNRSTEVALMSAFRAARVKGWRRHFSIRGKPDFAFPIERVAIFVDGCFWHGCPKCGTVPASNRDYWQRKILRNVHRDAIQRRELRKRGWKVLRVWEHELRRDGIARVLRRIKKALAKREKDLRPSTVAHSGRGVKESGSPREMPTHKPQNADALNPISQI